MTKQIKIEELIPLLKGGYVAMDKDGDWTWFSDTPEIKEECNNEESRLLNKLWKNLEESFELREKGNIYNKYKKICKALKRE